MNATMTIREVQPRPEFLEPLPASPKAPHASRAAAIQRWRKAMGWSGPRQRYAREEDDDF